MDLAAKMKHLRHVAGMERGYNRPMTQVEVAQAIRAEVGTLISQSYLSQLERGRRQHLSAQSRTTLAYFFKVHPGYLVGDLDSQSDIHATMTRVALHPRREQIILLIDRMTELHENDLHHLYQWMDERHQRRNVEDEDIFFGT